MPSQKRKQNKNKNNKSSKGGSGKQTSFATKFHLLNQLSFPISGVSQLTIAPSLS